jgi:hypothetical protein
LRGIIERAATKKAVREEQGDAVETEVKSGKTDEA